MTLRDKLAKVRLQEYLDAEGEFEFPEFVRFIRKSQGIPRKRMGEDLGCTEMRIFRAEEGKFKKMPEISFLAEVATYLGIPKTLLVNKAKIYVSRKR